MWTFTFLFLKDPPDWSQILVFFRGSELQNYFTKILEDNLKAIIKPQYVDQIPKAIKGTVDELLTKRCEVDNLEEIMREFGKIRFFSRQIFKIKVYYNRVFIFLELVGVKNRNIEDLSGGELQRFACAVTCVRKSDM